MSGEAGGLILVPLAVAALPLVVGGLAVAGLVKAGTSIAKYHKQQSIKREEIRTSKAAQNIGDFRQTMYSTMNEQVELNQQTSNRMMLELENQRASMLNVLRQNDTAAYQNYLSSIKQSHQNTMQTITNAQNDFNTSYHQKISESMAVVTQSINQNFDTYMNELQQYKADIAAKNQKAQEFAHSYLEEAKILLMSLADDFDGKKFVSKELLSLNNQLNQAITLYNNGRFEGAIASAKDVAVNTLEQIYEADAKKQEWENYYRLAMALSDEVKTYIESQAVITPEAKVYAENASGKTLEEEIVGINIAEYTDRNSRGQTRFDYLLNKANEMYNALRSPQAQNYSTEQLQSCISFLNNELYPAISMCINRAIVNMNNAFSRQNISEEIIDFFEEHNFMFNGYAYDDDCHDKALHIGLENEATGEELIITLAPELLENGDIQTHIDLKQIKGDEANEERKAYYRKCVEDVVVGNNPYAKVNIKCKPETKNKLSTDTETKKKLC